MLSAALGCAGLCAMWGFALDVRSSCLLALYHMVNSNHFSPDQRKRGKRVATLLAASFISGWSASLRLTQLRPSFPTLKHAC